MIYVVSHYYPPVVNPPAHRMNHLVRLLVERYGAEQVCVITGRPNHPHGELPPEYKWRLFKRRRGQWGERILHLYEVPTPNEGLIRKTLGYVSFAKALFFYLLFKRFAPEDIVFVTSPPVFTAYAVYLAACFRRRLRYVLDVRDLWPQAIAGIGFIREGTWIYRFFCRLSDRTYRRATQLVGNSQGIVDHLAAVDGCGRKRIDRVHNPVDMERIRALPPGESAAFRSDHAGPFGDGTRPVFVFAGMHSIYIDLMTLVRALKRVRAETDRFLFILIGYGEQKEELQAYIRENGLAQNVHFLPFMPREELLEYLSAADFCYVSLKATHNLRYAIPTKTLEYLACGKFVLAALEGPFADMLRAAGVAVVAEPGNPDSIAEAVETMIERYAGGTPPPDTRAFVREHFSLERFEEGFLACLEALLA